MKNNTALFTTGEFAKLHHLNKRTLHYYDEIGLFSPKHKGENGYRYYTYEQSVELENILALRELNMSIDEIKAYLSHPNSADFLAIASAKIHEIDKTIERLRELKSVLKQRREVMLLCDKIHDGEIEVVNLEAEYLLMTPLTLNYLDENAMAKNTELIMEHLRAAWELCAYKKSCGSFISLDKAREGMLDEYDGVFTVVDAKKKNLFIKPKGRYIRGFSIGDWDKLTVLYENIFSFADENGLKLTGLAFETGLNDFALTDMENYVSQVEILCGE